MPSHDARDYKFAVQHGLNIVRVIKSSAPDVNDELPFCEYGVMVNSGEFDGMTSEQGRVAIVGKIG